MTILPLVGERYNQIETIWATMSKSRPGLLPKYQDEEGMKEGSGKKGDEANGKEKGGD